MACYYARMPNCQQCGDLIEVYFLRRFGDRIYRCRKKASSYTQKYCSQSCGLKARHAANPLRKDTNPNWKGGRTRHAKGYWLVYAPDHPRQHKGYVLEHVLVMEQKLGRPMADDEVAHHMDENPANNHPDNLELKTRSQHSSDHRRKIDVPKPFPCTMTALLRSR